MVDKRSPEQLKLMRQSGKIAGAVLKKTLDSVKPGVTGLELDNIARAEIKRLGGEESYKTVPGYKWATCVTINDQVVHGIPTDRKIEKGDLVSIDLAVMYQGWHTDTAWTVIAGEGSIEAKKLLQVGEEALWLGIKQAVAGHTVGDIGAAIQGKVEGSGYHVVRSLVGHGVGKKLHEDPEVPGFGKAGTGLVLEPGMTLAIEVIYGQGTSDLILEDDNWTYSTADGSISGLFEMTIVVGSQKAEVLTDFRKKSL